MLEQAHKIIQAHIKQHNTQHIYVAYSGGIDSTALLHLIAKFSNDVKIHAIHIHHGLSPNADLWQKHCEEIAYVFNINFITHKLIPPQHKSNIESWARDARYHFFAQTMTHTQNNLLVTGHHQQDQAETFLLNALRGSGVKGLSAIAQQRSFANGYLIRPLLEYTKREITEYCIQNTLKWIEDESNNCTDFRRNAIRHNIIPELEKLALSATKTLARSADLCTESTLLLNEFLAPIIDDISIDSSSINLEKFIDYSELKCRYALKNWLDQHGFSYNF